MNITALLYPETESCIIWIKMIKPFSLNKIKYRPHIFCFPAKKSRKSNIQQVLYIFEIKATYDAAGQLIVEFRYFTISVYNLTKLPSVSTSWGNQFF